MVSSWTLFPVILFINPTVTYYHHVDIAPVCLIYLFTYVPQKYSVPHIEPRYMCWDRQRWRYGIWGPPIQIPSAAHRPADCSGSGIGYWRWGPIKLWYPGPRSVSVPPPSTVGDPRGRGGCMLWWAGSFFLVMTLQLTMFGPWKRVESMFQTWGFSRMIIPTPPFASPSAVVVAFDNITSYPIIFRKCAWSLILVSVRIISSKPPIRAARMACMIPDPRPLWMWYFPIDSPGGYGGRFGSGTM